MHISWSRWWCQFRFVLSPPMHKDNCFSSIKCACCFRTGSANAEIEMRAHRCTHLFSASIWPEAAVYSYALTIESAIEDHAIAAAELIVAKIELPLETHRGNALQLYHLHTHTSSSSPEVRGLFTIKDGAAEGIWKRGTPSNCNSIERTDQVFPAHYN